MKLKDMRRLAELAQDFYAEKQKESGMIEPLRKAWASNEEEGLLIIVSTFGVHSRTLAEQTGIPWKEGNTKAAEPTIDFHCHVCGVETDLAPDPPAKAVCLEHCEDHDYVSMRGTKHCQHCGQEVPIDYYLED